MWGWKGGGSKIAHRTTGNSKKRKGNKKTKKKKKKENKKQKLKQKKTPTSLHSYQERGAEQGGTRGGGWVLKQSSQENHIHLNGGVGIGGGSGGVLG